MPDSPGPLATPRLLIVSPAKDEARYLERTIASVTAQTIRPSRWIIVDDGSSDRTGEIADSAASEHPWIEVLHRPRGPLAESAPGSSRHFMMGYRRRI